MLKLFRFEFKRVAVFPLSIALLGAILNIVFMICCAAGPADNVMKWINTANNISTIFIIIVGATVIGLEAATCLKPYSIYDLSEVSEKKLTAVRMLLVLSLTAFTALIMIAETTAVGYIALKRAPEYFAENPGIYIQYSLCLIDRTFAAWLQPLAIGTFFTWAFALIISCAPLIKYSDNRFVKFMVAIAVIAVGTVIQMYVGSLFANVCYKVDFNAVHHVYDTVNYGDTYGIRKIISGSYVDIPYGLVSTYNNDFNFTVNNFSYTTFNILNLGLDLFIFVQILCCLIMYSLRRVTLDKHSSTQNKKQLLKLILPALLIVFYVSFAPAVVSDKPVNDALRIIPAETNLTSNQVVYPITINLPYDESGTIDLEKYIDFSKLNKLSAKYNTYYNVQGASFGKYSDMQFYSVGEGIDYTDGSAVITVENRGKYTFYLSVQNKYTKKTKAVTFTIFYGQETADK